MVRLKIKVFNFLTLLILAFSTSILEGASIEFYIEKLKSKDFNERLSAIDALRNKDDEIVVDTLIDLLRDKTEDWRIQIKAISLLGDLKNPKSLEILLEYFDNVFINHECPAIKLNTAIALSNFEDNPQAFDALVKNLHYKDLQIREAVIESLGKLKRKEAISYLLPILNENSFALRYKALKAIADIGDNQAITYLNKFIRTEKEPLLKREALKAIRKLY